MGVKPFYYYLSDESFFFATELKALINTAEIPCQLNELRVADYLISLIEDSEITFYTGIRRLPATHHLTVEDKGENIKCYWKLDTEKETLMGSDEEYAAKFLEIFTDAVECRLRSAYPVGSLLSGGLDSSSVTCTARKILQEKDGNKKLKTFSTIYNNLPECDEQEYIQKVLDGGDLGLI